MSLQALSRIKTRIILPVCLGLILQGNVWAGEQNRERSLRVGLLPYLSNQKLLNTFAPLAKYLERKLHRKVLLVTAPDFASYFKRGNLGQYDIYVTAPHLAAYAEIKHRHRRLVRPEKNMQGTFMVPIESKIKNLSGLKGKVLAAPDSLAVITMVAERFLMENGLVPGQDVFIRNGSSHNNAVATVFEGLSDAAVSLSTFYDGLDQQQKLKLRVIAITPSIPHGMFMASPDLDTGLYRSVLSAMLAFPDAQEGEVFFKRTAFIGFVEISDADMSLMKKFAPQIEGRVK